MVKNAAISIRNIHSSDILFFLFLPPSHLSPPLTVDKASGGHVWGVHDMWGMHQFCRPHLWMVFPGTEVGRTILEKDLWNGNVLISGFNSKNGVCNPPSSSPLHRCTRQVNCSPVGTNQLEWTTSVDQCPAITRAEPPIIFFPQLMVRDWMQSRGTQSRACCQLSSIYSTDTLCTECLSV